MTVCIAALGRDDAGEPVAVVAADRMVTLGGFIEFEHAVPKMAESSPFAVAMVAGETLVGTRLARDVAGALAGTSPKTSDIAAAIANRYEGVRRQSLEHQLLTPRGLDLASFYQAHAVLNGQITMMLDQQMAQYNLGVEVLLAGVDDDGGHVFSVHNPGMPDLQHDIIGYASVGSGAIHALQSMIGFGHQAAASARDTLFRVYASKRRAEVAPGVGHDTDMAVISKAGITWLPADQITELEKLYEQFEDSMRKVLTDELTGASLAALEGMTTDATAQTA